ncbi:putative metal-dependent hydrolase YjjV [Pseudidiomarina piscicola]|uniref:Putative metal-dependent hydrolase YjjV n=1 Tax=Pseudidiomarina piscicola TaxID=2614830 RepID=A0A6S6WPJ3_9GAMM|nr:TatD family hydrolase [Pseudidiomarina piscicola]CAB0152006.1 putative metal-dependent hydrolase YjjV [Pseudidiomarina piscicola]VZT41446.1 putative metal-dependent hydrolase YjjV [Pseudomonas aeruginosa]
MNTNLFDSHCHLDFESFDDDREEVVKRAYAKGVHAILVPGTRRKTPKISSDKISKVALYYAVGLHPYFIDEHQSDDIAWVQQQLETHANYWVGEIGLDRTCHQWDKQCELFEQQVKLAKNYQRPVILHHRKSQSDLLGILAPYLDELPQFKGILHAFSGSPEQAQDWVDKGFKLGVGGTITYARAKKTRAAIQAVPLSALLLETDAPDMPLQGFQGKRNEPAQIAEVLSALIALRSESAAQVTEQLWRNSQTAIQALASVDSATC